MPADDLGKLTDFIGQPETKRITSTSHETAAKEPVFSSDPLIAYKYDPSLAEHEDVIFTVKTTLQLEKNDYQAEL